MKQQTPTMAEDILLALVIAATIVLLFAAGENQGVAADLIRIVLWPGRRLASATGHGAHDVGVLLTAIGDTIVYGFVSFLALRVLRTMLKY